MFYRKADKEPDGDIVCPEEDVRAAAQKICIDVFGEAPEGGLTAKQSTYHHVYLFKAGGKDRIFKASKFDSLKYQLFLENEIYNDCINNTGMGAEVRRLDIGCRDHPFAYMVMDAVGGLCLRGLDLDSSLFPVLMNDLGAITARCHMPFPEGTGFGLINAEKLFESGEFSGAYESWDEYFFTNLDEHLDFCVENGVLDPDQRSDIGLLFKELTGLVNSERCCLLHGDLGSHNIFYDQYAGEVRSIIDWEDALAGDPLFDIAMWLSFYRMEEYLDAFMEGYQQVNKFPDERLRLKLWVYYLRIVIAKAVHRVKFGYDDSGPSKSVPKIHQALKKIKDYT